MEGRRRPTGAGRRRSATGPSGWRGAGGHRCRGPARRGARPGRRGAARPGRRARGSPGSRPSGPIPGSATRSARNAAASRPASSTSVPSDSAAASPTTVAVRRAGLVSTSTPRSATVAAVGNSRSGPSPASAGGSRSPSAAASRAAARAGSRERDLLAEHRTQRRLARRSTVPGNRSPARPRRSTRARIGAQRRVHGDGVGVEVEAAAGGRRRGRQVAGIGEAQGGDDVRRAAGVTVAGAGRRVP